MPKQIFSFTMRGHNLGNNLRLESKEQAQELYDAVNSAIKASDDFVELKIGEEIASIRARDITAFGITVTLEETPEERKARAILEIERQMAYQGEATCNADYGVKTIGRSLGGGLL